MILNLPMMAIALTGIDSKIELSIDEVFGFPSETSYGGGYGAKGLLTIISGNYSVSGQHYFTTGELYEFFKQLKKCYEMLSGSAVLENTERELELRCEFNKQGHVVISGVFQVNPIAKNILHFELKSDQTQVFETLSLLRKVHSIFGDSKGVST